MRQQEGTEMNYTAKEIMTAGVMSIGPEETIQCAATILAEHHISGLPVVDEHMKVVGVISSSDIVKFSGQAHIVSLVGTSGWVSPYTDPATLTSLNTGFQMLGKKKIKEIMTKRVVTVPESATIDEVARILSKKKINRLPVVNDQGQLVGIITRTDLITAMAGDR
jgi:CBS domain-containing protein